MITKILKWKIASISMARLVQMLSSVFACLIFIVGARKLCELNLTGEQLYLANGVLCISVLQLLIVALIAELVELLDSKGNAA